MKSNSIVDNIIFDNIPDITSYTDDINQYDDNINDYNINKSKICDYWKSIPQFEQKSEEWLNQRKGYIGGSEAGAFLGHNHYEPQYKAIEKKLINIPIINKIHTYHGNKYEDVAQSIYEYCRNVRVDNYGFLPYISFDKDFNPIDNKDIINNKILYNLGASPDGITSNYKYDRIHKTKENGIMLEIKCPPNRKINMDKNATIKEIVPIYYYYQVQQQLNVCNLDECDFFQIKVVEYNDTSKYKARELFNKDTNPDCPFKTKDNKFKGAVIQILPESFKGKPVNSEKFNTPELKSLQQQIYDQAKFIIPPRLDMTPKQIKEWIISVKTHNIPDNISDFEKQQYYTIKKGYLFHKVFYWKLDHGRCTRIKRNKEEFNDNLKIYNQMWEYVKFLRNPNNINQHNTYINICNHINQCIEQYNQYHYDFRDKNNYLEKQNNLIMDILNKMFNNNYDNKIVQNSIKDFKKYFDDLTIYKPEYKIKYNKDNESDSDSDDEIIIIRKH